ncbi:unnamed protein product [Peronospora destructor]|uniref:Tc3 transposase DNA binding domain-containing protein n=2 Tax=Peronospora destructor TaxID=86335 RepID=A0AAV0VIC3_9STRA|nr:unnamed protein product [Peronospora destructor]
MAKSIWVSDEERVKILQMRKDGVSVSTIAKKTERSTNFIYRILKKANDSVQTKTKHKTCNTSAINGPSAPIAAAESNDRRDRLWGDLPDSTAAFLCAVEGMEVSSYEPIPMPRSMKSFEQRYNQVQQSRLESVNVNVGFAGAPVAFDAGKPQSVEATDEFWLLTDTTSSSLTNMNADSTDGLNKLLKQIQDEIRRLEGSAQSDVYDAQLLQLLVKFYAQKILLMQLQKTLSDTESSKRARDTDTDGNETSRLLREKLAKEIALLNVHADRETLELERERIRHKTTSMICRKTLLDANTPQADVDQLFSYQ